MLASRLAIRRWKVVLASVTVTGLVLITSEVAHAVGPENSAGANVGSVVTVNNLPVTYSNQDTNVNFGQSTAPGSASAQTSGTCYSGYTCFWVNINEGGDVGQIQGTNGWWGAWSEAQCTGSAAAPDSNQTWNDCASSLWDTQAVPQTFYANINQGGTSLMLAANQYQAQLSVTPSGNVNDAISSNQRG